MPFFVNGRCDECRRINFLTCLFHRAAHAWLCAGCEPTWRQERERDDAHAAWLASLPKPEPDEILRFTVFYSGDLPALTTTTEKQS